MKHMAKWKKRFFLILAILILVRVLYIMLGADVEKEYVTTAVDTLGATEVPCLEIAQNFVGEHERLNSLELIFTGLTNDINGAVTIQILQDEELLYQSKLSLKNLRNWEWKKVYVNCPIEVGEEYVLLLAANEQCVQTPNVLQLAGEDGPRIAVKYGYWKTPGMTDRVVTASLWILLGLLATVVVFGFEKIKQGITKCYEHVMEKVNPDVFRVAAELVLCLIILHSSGIEFEQPTKIIFYVLSLCAVMNAKEKKDFIEQMADKGGKRALLYFVYVYAAFALVGQRILIFPLDAKVTVVGLFVFGATVLWFIPVVQSAMYWLECLSQKSVVAKNKCIKTTVFVALALVMLLLPAAYNLYANNPGISSYDTRISMADNAHNIHGMYDWHPAFYCMVLRVIMSVWDSTYAVILVQYFFWAYVMLELFLYLRKKGVRDSVTLSAALLTGFTASNFMHINTIWKDIPYALSVMWAFVILAKLSFDFEEYKGKWYIYVELVVALIGIFFYRKNGIVTFAIIAVMMAVFLRKNIKMWCALAVTVLLTLIIKYPVYSYFEIEDPGKYGIYIGLSQDILGVYYAGGEVSEETLQMINVMTAYNNAEFDYTPTYSRQSYDLDVEMTQFIGGYLDTFFRNPVTMVRAVIAREDAMWNVFRGADAEMGCVNYSGTQDGVENWNDYYPKRVHTGLYDSMSAATAYTANSQWISAIQWRAGLFTLLGLIAVAFIVIKCGVKKYALVVAPMIGHILGLLLSTGWSDFRYFWPLNLMNMGILLLTLVVVSKNMVSE